MGQVIGIMQVTIIIGLAIKKPLFALCERFLFGRWDTEHHEGSG